MTNEDRLREQLLQEKRVDMKNNLKVRYNQEKI